MSDEQDEIFFVPPTTIVEIDAVNIAAIIADSCRVEDALAVEAANLIIDHLIQVHRHAMSKP